MVETMSDALAELQTIAYSMVKDDSDWEAGETANQIHGCVDRLRSEIEALKARVAELEDAASMACECPPSGCDCAGCRYADEKHGVKR